jgi:5-methylcytosine-specific restriction enzyme A
MPVVLHVYVLPETLPALTNAPTPAHATSGVQKSSPAGWSGLWRGRSRYPLKEPPPCRHRHPAHAAAAADKPSTEQAYAAVTTPKQTACAAPALRDGYGKDHRDHFRTPVLEAAGYVCQWPDGCTAEATDADHHPSTRRELIAKGLDPNDPRYGRALCARHHHQHTASYTPGFGSKPRQ